MRSVKNSMFEKFKHTTLDGQCVIDSKTRQSCKKCRYEKCLQAGMRNAFVQKQAGSIAKERCLTNVFLKDEEMFLNKLYDDSTSVTIENTLELYIQNLQLAHEHFTKPATEWTCEDLATCNEIDKYLTKKMALCLGQGLSVKEISILYDCNFERMQQFYLALWFYDLNGDHRNSEFSEYLEFAEKWERRNEDKAVVLINLMKQCNIKEATYDAMFVSPWASHYDVEDEHRNLCQRIFDWIHASRKYSNKIDKCLIILMSLILLHNTDGMNPSQFIDIEKVQNTQQKYVILLHKYLKSHLSTKEAFNQLHNGLMMVHATNRINELFEKRLQLETVRNITLPSNSPLLNLCESFDQSKIMTDSSDSDSNDSLIGHEDLVEDFLKEGHYSLPSLLTLTVD